MLERASFMAEARAERRLAAILATDVVGYSRLMGGDEEGTLAALKSLRKSLIDPKIAEHRGRIVRPRVTVPWSSLPARSMPCAVQSISNAP